MAQYFAQLDDNNMVTHVAVVQKDFLDANPDRYTGRWVETFIDKENKVYAGIGYFYDEQTDNFVPPAPVVYPKVAE